MDDRRARLQLACAAMVILVALGVLSFEEGIPLGYPRSVLYRLAPTCP